MQSYPFLKSFHWLCLDSPPINVANLYSNKDFHNNPYFMSNFLRNFLATRYIYIPNSLVGARINAIGPSNFFEALFNILNVK